MLTTKQIERAVEETRDFGYSYLGELCFDVIKDSKKVNNYLRKHDITDMYLIYRGDEYRDTRDGSGWFLIIPA